METVGPSDSRSSIEPVSEVFSLRWAKVRDPGWWGHGWYTGGVGECQPEEARDSKKAHKVMGVQEDGQSPGQTYFKGILLIKLSNNFHSRIFICPAFTGGLTQDIFIIIVYVDWDRTPHFQYIWHFKLESWFFARSGWDQTGTSENILKKDTLISLQFLDFWKWTHRTVIFPKNFMLREGKRWCLIPTKEEVGSQEVLQQLWQFIGMSFRRGRHGFNDG